MWPVISVDVAMSDATSALHSGSAFTLGTMSAGPSTVVSTLTKAPVVLSYSRTSFVDWSPMYALPFGA